LHFYQSERYADSPEIRVKSWREKAFYFGVRAGRGFNWQGQIGLEGTQINQISDVCKFAQKSYFQVAASGGYT
jgi:hypothetical protein